jgi:hypothetical protein
MSLRMSLETRVRVGLTNEASAAVGTELEGLGELERSAIVHDEGADHHDHHAAVQGAWLQVVLVELIVNLE